MDLDAFWDFWDKTYLYWDAYDIAILLELFDILCILLPLLSYILIGVHIPKTIRLIKPLTPYIVRLTYVLWNILEYFLTNR